jgi:hypothetical protein
MSPIEARISTPIGTSGHDRSAENDTDIADGAGAVLDDSTRWGINAALVAATVSNASRSCALPLISEYLC